MPGFLFQAPDPSDDLAASGMGRVPAEMVKWLRGQMDIIFRPLSAATSAADFLDLRDQSFRSSLCFRRQLTIS